MTGRIDRVLVTLEAASENTAPIVTAMRLAARAAVPLHGIFVEDEDLLAIAGSPVARHVTFGTAAQPYTVEAIEQHLRVEAERGRDELFEAAKRYGVRCTFEVVRGTPAVAIAGASGRNLVVAGALGRPIAGYFRLECRWWSSIGMISQPLLLARHRSDVSGGVVLLLRNCSETAARLLDTAVQVAEASGGVLAVLCPSELAGAKDFDRWLAERLEAHAVTLRVEVAAVEPVALRQRVQELGCRLLAIEGSVAEEQAREFRSLAESQLCDVLIVR